MYTLCSLHSSNQLSPPSTDDQLPLQPCFCCSPDRENMGLQINTYNIPADEYELPSIITSRHLSLPHTLHSSAAPFLMQLRRLVSPVIIFVVPSPRHHHFNAEVAGIGNNHIMWRSSRIVSSSHYFFHFSCLGHHFTLHWVAYYNIIQKRFTSSSSSSSTYHHYDCASRGSPSRRRRRTRRRLELT